MLISRHEGGHKVFKTGWINLGNMIVLNIYAPKLSASNFIKNILMAIKAHRLTEAQ